MTNMNCKTTKCEKNVSVILVNAQNNIYSTTTEEIVEGAFE